MSLGDNKVLVDDFVVDHYHHDDDDNYQPRRSNLVNEEDVAQADGDVWQQRLAVCEGASNDGQPRLLVRSYYRSIKTGERIWDEPPSGASKIIHATPDMHKQANEQMQELFLTLEMIPPDNDAEQQNQQHEQNDSYNSSPRSTAGKKVKKSRGFFSRFRNKKNKKDKKTLEVSKDLNLQKAIARSMADQHGAGLSSTDPIVYYDTSTMNGQRQEDEELELARALSLSQVSNNNVTEEEMLQRAMEESQYESAQSGGMGVASMPAAPLLREEMTPSPPSPKGRKVYKNYNNNNDFDGGSDHKMAAIPSHLLER